jgi:hypothetical protein
LIPTITNTNPICYTNELCFINVGTYTSTNFACSDMDNLPVFLEINGNGFYQSTASFPMSNNMSNSQLSLSMTPTTSLIGSYQI